MRAGTSTIINVISQRTGWTGRRQGEVGRGTARNRPRSVSCVSRPAPCSRPPRGDERTKAWRLQRLHTPSSPEEGRAMIVRKEPSKTI